MGAAAAAVVVPDGENSSRHWARINLDEGHHSKKKNGATVQMENEQSVFSFVA